MVFVLIRHFNCSVRINQKASAEAEKSAARLL